MNRVWSTRIAMAAGMLLGGAWPVVSNAGAAQSAAPGGEIRFPLIEGNRAASKSVDPSSPPEIPFSIVDEVPGKSPGAVSGSWITIFEIDLQPVGTGTLGDAEPLPDEPVHPNEAEWF